MFGPESGDGKGPWTPYALRQLRAAGVSVPPRWTSTDGPLDDDATYAALSYETSTERVPLEFSVQLQPARVRMEEVEHLGDFVTEWLSVTPMEKPGSEVNCQFLLRGEDAHLDFLHHSNESNFAIPYVTGRRYSAKEVVDDMIRLDLLDLRGARS